MKKITIFSAMVLAALVIIAMPSQTKAGGGQSYSFPVYNCREAGSDILVKFERNGSEHRLYSGCLPYPNNTGEAKPISFYCNGSTSATASWKWNENCNTACSAVKWEERFFGNYLFSVVNSMGQGSKLQKINFEQTNLNAATGYWDAQGVKFYSRNGRMIYVNARNRGGATTASGQYSLFNDAVYPKNSANDPLVIEFKNRVRYVGFYLGNGQTSNDRATATVRVYGINGNLLGQKTNIQINRAVNKWVSFTTKEYIRRVEIDYGSSKLSESIDDLYFIDEISAYGVNPIPEVSIDKVSFFGRDAQYNRTSFNYESNRSYSDYLDRENKFAYLWYPYVSHTIVPSENKFLYAVVNAVNGDSRFTVASVPIDFSNYVNYANEASRRTFIADLARNASFFGYANAKSFSVNPGKITAIVSFIRNNDGISRVPGMPVEVDDIAINYFVREELPNEDRPMSLSMLKIYTVNSAGQSTILMDRNWTAQRNNEVRDQFFTTPAAYIGNDAQKIKIQAVPMSTNLSSNNVYQFLVNFYNVDLATARQQHIAPVNSCHGFVNENGGNQPVFFECDISGSRGKYMEVWVYADNGGTSKYWPGINMSVDDYSSVALYVNPLNNQPTVDTVLPQVEYLTFDKGPKNNNSYKYLTYFKVTDNKALKNVQFKLFSPNSDQVIFTQNSLCKDAWNNPLTSFEGVYVTSYLTCGNSYKYQLIVTDEAGNQNIREGNLYVSCN